MNLLKLILAAPAVIYINTFRLIWNKAYPMVYRMATAINFILINFWLIYYAFKPFLRWEVGVETALVILSLAIVDMGLLTAYNITERRRIKNKMEELLERINNLEDGTPQQ